MTNMPKAVVFDIGNVLLEWEPDKIYADLIPDPAERQAIFAEVGIDAMNEAIDRGAPFRETVYAKAAAFPQYAGLIRPWHDRWIEMASPWIDGTMDILLALKAQGTPVLALSNFGVESYALAKSVYPGLHAFDREYISGHLRVTKPDPAIYQALETGSGFSGADLVFFDDRADNIATAKARGWHGRVFTSPEQMASDLMALGFTL